MRKSTIERIQSLTRQQVALEAAHDEAGALRLQAKIDQISAKAGRTKQAYDVFAKHGHFSKFKTRRALWQQARRAAHGDTSGTAGPVALARQFEPLLADAQATDASIAATAFRLATIAKAEEAAHYAAVRNQIAELENEDTLRDILVKSNGDLEVARALAKELKVSWAPIANLTGDDDDDDGQSRDTDGDTDPDERAAAGGEARESHERETEGALRDTDADGDPEEATANNG